MQCLSQLIQFKNTLILIFTIFYHLLLSILKLNILSFPSTVITSKTFDFICDVMLLAIRKKKETNKKRRKTQLVPLIIKEFSALATFTPYNSNYIR